ASSRSPGEDLVDGRQARVEPVSCGPQIQAPYAGALDAGERLCLLYALVEAARPVAKGRRVVLAEALDVTGVEAGALDRELDAGERKGLAVGGHVAGGEQILVRVMVGVQRGDRVVQERRAGPQEPEQGVRIAVDLVLAHVLGHADARDSVEGGGRQLAVVRHTDLHLVRLT